MRRIVTENGPDGKSRIMQVVEMSAMGAARGTDGQGLIWESDVENPLGFEPRAAESLDFLPGGLKGLFLALPPESSIKPEHRENIEGVDNRGFHRTGTLDFLILLQGEMTLELDEGSICMEVGDVVVQRDTIHAWRNTGDRPNLCFAVVHKPQG